MTEQKVNSNTKRDKLQKHIETLLSQAVKQEFEEPCKIFKSFEESESITSFIETNIESGLKQDEVTKNRKIQGENDRMEFEETPCYKFFCDPLADPMLIILIVAAIISIPVGMFENDWSAKGALEGIAILIAVCIVVIVSAYNDWAKEQEFKKLQEVQANSAKFFVLRNGVIVELEFEELVIGDIIKLEQGTQVPVDVIMIKQEGQAVKIDESSVTGESDLIQKCTITELMEGTNKSVDGHITFPVLISGSTVNEGTAQAIVVTVGEYSYIRQQTKLDADDESPLQEKLEVIATQVGYFGIISAIATVVAIIGKIVQVGLVQGDWENTLSKILKAIIIGISVIVCAIPEGLPLAVTISLAYSVRKMMDDNNLVKKINSCETMGNADCICTDKTGTLTENRMTIMEVWGALENKPSKQCQQLIGDKFMDQFRRTVLYDCAINFRDDDSNPHEKGLLECVGSKTEVACVNLFCDLNKFKTAKDNYNQNKLKEFLDVRESGDFSKLGEAFIDDFTFVKQWPFNSKQKMSCALIKKGGDQELMLKGAPDFLVNNNMLYESVSGPQPLNDEVQTQIMSQLTNWSEQCYRNIALCHYKVDFDVMEEGKVLKDPFAKLDKSKYILQGLVGIEDPLRNTVAESIEKCKKAGITVRMITGDNKETAFAIAKKCGILDAEIPKSDLDKQVISGQKFNELTGGTKEIQSGEAMQDTYDEYSIANVSDEELDNHKREAEKLKKMEHNLKKTQMVKNLDWFKNNIEDIRVMARSQPVDKFTMVTGLMQLDHIVAVTGDGANDASALSKSSVGFAMGIAGTQAAKEACDIVILDDNFTSIVRAVLWGRNVFDGVRKFLQFQLSVNLVAVLTTFISSAFDSNSHSSLTAVQLLWVNMIMDSLGALALATDEPTEVLLARKPYHKREKIINNRILVSVIIVGLFQTLFICIFLQAGHLFLPCMSVADDDKTTYFNCNNGLIRLNGDATHQDDYLATEEFNSQHYTIVFNLFIFMQIFNLLNCRKIDSYNFLSGIEKNSIQLIVWVGILVMQILLGNFGGVFFSVYKNGMSLMQWLWVIGFSILMIPISLLTKQIIFEVLKLNDGENDLDEEEEEGE